MQPLFWGGKGGLRGHQQQSKPITPKIVGFSSGKIMGTPPRLFFISFIFFGCQCAKTIKELLDKKFGASWHVVVGEGFGFEISYEVGVLYLVTFRLGCGSKFQIL